MRRYIVLSVVGLFAFVLLFIFFQKSESALSANHQNVLGLILNAKHIEATLEKDLLKSRNFLLLNYDSIVETEKNAEEICANLKKQSFALYSQSETSLKIEIDEYCQALEKKLDDVEFFKSKNAILKNSIYFVQKVATEELEDRGSTHATQTTLQRKIIKLAMAYALISNPETKEALRIALSDYQKIQAKAGAVASEEMEILISHVQRIFEIKEPLDLLTKEIVSANSEKFLEKIKQKYFVHFSKSEAAAHIFRKILFGSCILFLGFIILNIAMLWRAARKLTFANANLEMRVLERTKELQESKEKIVHQQQALINSAKLSSLGEMAGGVAHEINTPLAIISLRVEQLEECISDGTMDPVEIVETLDTIKKTTKRIAKIVSGLRFFARDGKNMPTQPANVSDILKETIGFCQEKFSNHGVTLIIENHCDKDLQMECRSVEISQVLLNLLNNAFDAIENIPKKWVQVQVKDRNEYVEITIIDCGAGIPKDLHDKIMQPFFSTKEIGKGTGLGLSISRGIVEAHQGKLTIDATAANTSFVVLLPKKQKRADGFKESA